MSGGKLHLFIWVGNQSIRNDQNLFMMRDLITEEALMKATGYAQRGRLIAHLKKHGVSYFVGNRGRIWTTIKAIDSALASGDKDDEDSIEF
jgi:hypothetical protein